MAKVSSSMAFESLAGGLPGATIARGRSGMILKRRPVFRPNRNEAQTAASQRLKQANAVWATLTRAQAAAWDDYAAQIERTNSLTGERYSPLGYHVFTGLATKFLQVKPSEPVPTMPPTKPFRGDSLEFTVWGVSGEAVWSATGSNSSDTTTELLVIPLKNERAKAGSKTRGVGFHAFSPVDPIVAAPLEAGWYELAYRYVRISTGEQLPWERLGVVQVI